MSGPPDTPRPTDPPPPPEDASEHEPTVGEKLDEAAAEADEAVSKASDAAQEQVRERTITARDEVRQAGEQLNARIRDTESTVRRGLASVQDVAGELTGLSEPTPAESVDHAVEQAASLRRAIDRDLDALQARMPPGEELADKARQIGGVALAVGGVGAAIFLANKQRSERKRVEREAEAHAAAIARYLPQAQLTPREDDDDGGGKLTLLLAVLAAIVAFVVSKQRTGDDEPDIWGPPR